MEKEVDDSDIVEGTGNKFSVERAKSGRSTCRDCKKKINKDVLRISKLIPFKDIHVNQFFHVDCAFQTFKRARLRGNIIGEIGDVDGVESLRVNEVQVLIDAIQKANAERTNNLPEEYHRAKKKIELVAPANARKAKLKSSTIPTMKILFTNADQLTESKMTELVAKIDQEKPLIVAVSEVKMKNSSKKRAIEDYQIPNYTLHDVNLTNDTGRGIAVYIHKSIEKSAVEIKLDGKFEESCLVEIRLRGGDVMLFCCCYRSPTASDKSEENNEKLNQLLRTISNKKYSHRCIVGDFNLKNINWTNWSTPMNEKSTEARFIEAVRDCYLFQHISTPTRHRGTDNPSLLDLLFTDEEMNVSDIQHHSPLGKSDHNVIIFDYNCYLDFSKPKDMYSYSKGDYPAMRSHVESTNMAVEILTQARSQNIEEMWASLKSMVEELKRGFVPKAVVSGKPAWTEKGSFPISDSSREAIKEKRKCHREWMKVLREGNSPEDARLAYTKSVSKVKSLLRKEKRKFEKGIASEAKTKPKGFWSHARRKLKTKVGVSPLLSNPADKDSLKFEDSEKANILQTQFSSVFTKEPGGNIPRIPRRCRKKLLDFNVSEKTVKELIEKLNPDKSLGPDNIHARMLIELKDQLAEPLAFIFNETLRRGKVPRDWKRANVSPIFKKGSRNLPENYRPISLTSIVCKMMETLIRDRLMQHLKEEKLLSPKQHGFISGRSTVTQLLNYLDKCIQNTVDGHVVDAIYLDFAKAFDTVPHRRLIGKMEAYGISGALLEWVKDYLHGRTQTVLVNGEKSYTTPVISGIPQGTCLGPLLFVIYINDLLDDIESDGFLFADDTKIFRKITSAEDSAILQSDIDKLENWAAKWLLKFHPDKCHVLSLGKEENTMYTYRYSICGKEMDHVFEEKDLGVVIDSGVTFEEHILSKVNIANAMVGLIRRTFSYLDPKMFRMLFTAFVRPHLEYAVAVWSPHLKKHVDMIENVQMRATKLVDGFGKLTYRERLEKLKLPTLAYRRLRGDVIEIYKHFHRYDQEILPPSFIRRTRPSRQHNFQLHEFTPGDGERGARSNFLYHRIARVWNGLPGKIVSSENIDTFKNRFDAHMEQHPIKFDHRAGTTNNDTDE